MKREGFQVSPPCKTEFSFLTFVAQSPPFHPIEMLCLWTWKHVMIFINNGGWGLLLGFTDRLVWVWILMNVPCHKQDARLRYEVWRKVRHPFHQLQKSCKRLMNESQLRHVSGFVWQWQQNFRSAMKQWIFYFFRPFFTPKYTCVPSLSLSWCCRRECCLTLKNFTHGNV